MQEIELTQGYKAVVDDADYALVSQYNWHFNSRKEFYYARCHIKIVDGKSKKTAMHQLILDAQEGQTVIHRNGNGLDNRRENIYIQPDANIYQELGEVTEILFLDGQKAIVDTEDVEKIKEYKWAIDINKGVTYVKGHKSAGRIKLHRYIMDAPRGSKVDHINHDGLDNRKENLRICSHKENTWNQLKPKSYGGKECSSQYKGVSLMKATGKWIASIVVSGKRIHLGTHSNEESAAEAYNKAALEYFGEFALLNSI